jgi:large conductance mechanosensitive channel
MKILQGFKQFILRGNVVDLAVGVMIGAAFSGLVNSLVADVFTPLIGAVIKIPDFSNLTFSINQSVFHLGKFLNALISFLLTASAIYFFVVTPVNALIARSRKEKPADPSTKKCPECFSEIPREASRCAFCTTKLNS